MPFGGSYSPRSPGELRTYSFDMFRDLAPGDFLASITTSLSSTVDPNAETLLVGSPVILNGPGAYTSSYTAWIYGVVMTVTSAPTECLTSGATVSGGGVASGAIIVSQLSGVSGGIGTYEVNISQNVQSVAMTSTYRLRTVVAQQIGVNQNNLIGFIPSIIYVWTITAVTGVSGDTLVWIEHVPTDAGSPE